jgi:hypothetical protein
MYSEEFGEILFSCDLGTFLSLRSFRCRCVLCGDEKKTWQCSSPNPSCECRCVECVSEMVSAPLLKTPQLPADLWTNVSDRVRDLDALLRLTCVNKSMQKSPPASPAARTARTAVTALPHASRAASRMPHAARHPPRTSHAPRAARRQCPARRGGPRSFAVAAASSPNHA